MYVYTIVYTYVACIFKYSMYVVLSSRDWHKKTWNPNFMCLQSKPYNTLYPRILTKMHW